MSNKISGIKKTNEVKINNIRETLDNESNSIPEIIISKIADNYYYGIFVKFSPQQVEELLKIKNEDLKKLLYLYNDNLFYNHVGDILMNLIYRSIYITFLNNNHHQCWDCSAATALKCNKIRDYNKRNIMAYPFITDGFQVVDKKNGNKYFLDKFIVSKCNIFKKTKHK